MNPFWPEQHEAGLPNESPDVKASLLTYLYCFIVAISFRLCPEEIWIGGIALPALALQASFGRAVDNEAYGYQADVFLCWIGAIVAFWVELTVFLADKVVEILGHVIFQIILLGLLALMVPVGSLAEHQRQVLNESLAHLGNAEHRAVLVRHPGIHRRVDIKPLVT